MRHYVMVLNDGETYTSLAGCRVLVFDEEPTDEMVKEHNIENLYCRFDTPIVGQTPYVYVWRNPAKDPKDFSSSGSIKNNPYFEPHYWDS